MIYRYLLLSFAGLWLTCAGIAQPANQLETESRAYLEAVWAADWETMAGYLTDDSIYQDFTMTYFGIDEIDLIGRDSIVAFYRNANDGSGVLEVRNEIVYHFVAGNTVTYELDTFVRAEGETWGAPGQEITATFRVISFVQMDAGRVVRHLDFADYEEVSRQVAAQIEAGKQN